MTSSTNNVKIPAPMLPTTPLPLNVVTAPNVMYMYSCSQCEFKTHIESLFKQHVDSVHLGIPNVPSNAVLGQDTVAAALASVAAGGVATLPASVISVTQAGQAPPTIVVQQAGQLLTAATAPLPTVVTTTPSSATPPASDPKFHKCPKCNLLLPSKNQLTQHKRKVHGKAAQVGLGHGATPSSLTYAVVPHPQISQPSPPTSSPATVSLVTQAASAVLTATPTSGSASVGVTSGKKTYSCTACGYSTTRRDGLSQHYDSVHLKIKNHQCELCPYAASQKGTLNRHVKLRHKKKLGNLGVTGPTGAGSSAPPPTTSETEIMS